MNAHPGGTTGETTGDVIGGLAGWTVDLMDALGGPGAAVAVGLDNLFPPIPSELVLPLAGFTAAQGRFGLVEALLWTTAGSVLGALVVYLAGYWFGRDRTRKLITALPLVKESDVDRAEQWFARHGDKAVFFGRMVPLVRSFISVPAGTERMPFWRFTMLTMLGSLLWNSVFVLCGYGLGTQWHLVEDYAGIFQTVVIAAIILALVIFVVVRLRSRRRADAA